MIPDLLRMVSYPLAVVGMLCIVIVMFTCPRCGRPCTPWRAWRRGCYRHDA